MNGGRFTNPGHCGDCTRFWSTFPRMYQNEKAGLAVSRNQWPLAQLHSSVHTDDVELNAMAPPGVALSICPAGQRVRGLIINNNKKNQHLLSALDVLGTVLSKDFTSL